MNPQSKRFEHKIVITTGAARGIGQAIATRFAAEGAHVIINTVDIFPLSKFPHLEAA